jgi:hypothetical protein
MKNPTRARRGVSVGVKGYGPAQRANSPPDPTNDIVAAGGDPSVPSLQYTAALPDWMMIRTILSGAREIRLAGETYLPRFADESDQDYKARNQHAPFVNHFRDDIESITSKPFSKEVSLQGAVDSKIRALAEDIDGHGVSLHKFARDVFKEAVAFGKVGILVDYPTVDPKATLADERRLGARPYWVMYRAEDVIAFYTEFRKGRRYVTHVRLREDIIERFGFSERPKRRVRVLNDDPILGRTWELWETGGVGWTLVGQGNITLDEIPFRLFVPGEREWWTNHTVSPMIDLAYLQIEHYQQSSNLKHALEMTAFAMLAGNGVQPPIGPDGQILRIKVGPGVVLFAPPVTGISTFPEWKFIEPGAHSIDALQKQIEKIEQQMATLGKAPLVRSRGGITATAEAVNAAKGHAAAEAWANDEKDVLEQMFVFTA